jgi:uncharacterized membrane protein YphA (DoxX/SURF4 family)
MQLLLFTRVSIGTIFLISSLSKLLEFKSFGEGLANFQVSGRTTRHILAISIIALELCVVLLMIIGKQLLIVGFGLSITLLAIFCIAIANQIRNGRNEACNCFGASRTHITKLDLVRNGALILCSLVGLLSRQAELASATHAMDVAIVWISAVGFSTFLISMSQISFLIR